MPIILFFLNPAIALISAFLLNIKKHKKTFYIFAILFSLYLGISLTPNNQEIDSYQIVQIFKMWNSLFPSYFEFISEFIQFKNPFAKDIFEGTIFSFVHTFSDSYHYIFFFCALIFTVFKLLCLEYILKCYKYDGVHFIIVLFFFMSIPLFEINGFRFFTTAWLAIFATLKIYLDNERKYIYLLLILPLMHITFIFYIFMIMISYVLRNVNERLIIYVFFGSIIAGLIWDTLPNIGNVGDGILGNMLESYLNEDYKTEIEIAMSQSNFIKFFNPLRYLFYNITTFFLYKHSRGERMKGLLLMLLICLSITNCVRFIPSMSRFFIVLTPFILFCMNVESVYCKKVRLFVAMLPFVEIFRIYQIYFTLYPQILPEGFWYNILMVRL